VSIGSRGILARKSPLEPVAVTDRRADEVLLLERTVANRDGAMLLSPSQLAVLRDVV
jgi:hypothetical protein